MKIKGLHPNFRMPERGSQEAGGYDLFMPNPGYVMNSARSALMAPLGFAAAVPYGHVALLLPRSGAGAKGGLALNNTCGVIDADYRGEWVAALRCNNGQTFTWNTGDRILQMLIVPVASPVLEQVEELSPTARGAGGFGSTGKGVA